MSIKVRSQETPASLDLINTNDRDFDTDMRLLAHAFQESGVAGRNLDQVGIVILELVNFP